MRDIMFPTMAEGVHRQFFIKTMQGCIMGLFSKGEYGFKSRHSLDFTPQEKPAIGELAGNRFIVRG